jgi:putative ABC transport system permease protein
VQMGGPDAPWHTVIGVTAGVRHMGLDDTDLKGFYLPERHWNFANSQVVLVVRTTGDPTALAPAVVRAVRSVDPAQPIMHVRSGTEIIAVTTARRRLALTLFAAFGLVATLLSAAGVYGVLAGAVTERRREIGIRSALGATPHAIVRFVVRQGLALAGIGLVLGLGGALALSRYLRSMLFGIGPTDPLTLSATAVLLAAVALAACLIPAWRAMRVDPVTVLRSE